MGKIINHEGDTWEVIGVGASRDGLTYCHLRSTTRSRQAKNGAHWLQMADWIPDEVLA